MTTETIRPRDLAVARNDSHVIFKTFINYTNGRTGDRQQDMVEAAHWSGYRVVTDVKQVPGCVTIRRSESEFGWRNEHAWFILRIDADGLMTICDWQGNAV